MDSWYKLKLRTNGILLLELRNQVLSYVRFHSSMFQKKEEIVEKLGLTAMSFMFKRKPQCIISVFDIALKLALSSLVESFCEMY